MTMHRFALIIGTAIFVAGAALHFSSHAQQGLPYPQTKKVDHVDNYHGVTVADPYRWLEDDNSPETAKWVEEENKVTFAYLDKIPYRAKLKERSEKLYNYPKYSAPSRKGEYFYFYKNEGLQNQSVLYRQKGLSGVPEVVIDPNQLPPDGTSRMTNFDLSKDGTHAVYGISKGGSDWEEYFVMEMAAKKTLSDHLEW